MGDALISSACHPFVPTVEASERAGTIGMGVGTGRGRVCFLDGSVGFVEIHVLGGAWLCLCSMPPFGLLARGCRPVLVGQAYARVHEW